MPYEPRINPAAASAQRNSMEWADTFGLISSGTDRERLAEGGYADLCGYFYPEAGPEDLDLVTQWAVWEFTLDDLFSDTYQDLRDYESVRTIVSRLRGFLPVEAGPVPVPVSPVERALQDLWRRTVHRMTPCWRTRFFAGITTFAEAYVWETRNLLRGEPPDLVDHIQSRRYGSGTQPMLDLLELTMDFEIPPRLLGTRTLSSLMESIVDGIMHVNDLFSYRKEREHRDIHNNIHIMQETLGCSFDEAVRQVNSLATSRVRHYRRLIKEELPAVLDEQNVPPRIREQVLAWGRLSGFWLPGNLAWHRRTGRYTNVELWRPNGRMTRFGSLTK